MYTAPRDRPLTWVRKKKSAPADMTTARQAIVGPCEIHLWQEHDASGFLQLPQPLLRGGGGRRRLDAARVGEPAKNGVKQILQFQVS